MQLQMVTYTNRIVNACKDRVEVPVTDHLRDYAPNLEKYKVVQFFPMLEDKKNQEDCKKI